MYPDVVLPDSPRDFFMRYTLEVVEMEDGDNVEDFARQNSRAPSVNRSRRRGRCATRLPPPSSVLRRV
jgi:hypothetical protein